MNLDETFGALTGHGGLLSWQRRLYEKLLTGELPPALDLPTGLGKTSVMALWLMALVAQIQERGRPKLPRRLVYVVDRRVVVDQATSEAEKLQKALDEHPKLGWMRDALGLLAGASLPVSTLRGRLADNRAWLTDPAMPAIVVGTVDMTGSRLLFSGYGVSRGMRPVHAAMLGVDSLFVLDESHLVPPFERLLEQIAQGDARCWPEQEIVRPLKLLPLSATGNPKAGAFVLVPEDERDPLIAQRLGASKALSIEPVETHGKRDGLVQPLVETAWRLAFDEKNQPCFTTRPSGRAARVLIYCNSREVAQKVADGLRKKAKGSKRSDPPAAQVELYTGARRVLEREQAEERLTSLGFLAGSREDESLCHVPAFLVATSAAEVGVDLDADHLVADVVELERMIQRFGRVNRLGILAESRIQIVHDPDALRKEKDEPKRQRLQAVLEALQTLAGEASPAALMNLKRDHEALVESASSPPPLYPPLDPAHVEAWAMTSLKEHPGRPHVQPWLRGWVQEEPQATLLWRRHLPWRMGEAQPDPQEVEAFFQIAPPHLLEMLEGAATQVADTLIKCAKRRCKEKDSEEEACAGEPAVILLSKAGDFRQAWSLEALKSEKTTRLASRIANGLLVVSRMLGGLDANGLLDSKAGAPTTLDAGWEAAWLQHVGYQLCHRKAGESDGIDEQGPWQQAHRWVLERNEEGESVEWLDVLVYRDNAQLEGEPAIASVDYGLEDHLNDVAREARALARRLGLPEGLSKSLELAGWWHDVGKNRVQWQRAANAPIEPSRRLVAHLDLKHAYAKTRGPFRPALLGGYRHEFGSLLDALESDELAALTLEQRELMLHLVVAHHGHGRPSIPPLDPRHPPSRLQHQVQQVALRFARLQKRFGPWGLAWLEALVRAADRKASVGVATIGAPDRSPSKEMSHG